MYVEDNGSKCRRSSLGINNKKYRKQSSIDLELEDNFGIADNGESDIFS